MPSIFAHSTISPADMLPPVIRRLYSFSLAVVAGGIISVIPSELTLPTVATIRSVNVVHRPFQLMRHQAANAKLHIP